MNRRIYLIIILAILLLAIGGGLLYWAVQKQNEKTNQQKTVGLVKVSDILPISPVPSFDGSAIWYFDSDGKLFRMGSDGANLSEYPLPALADGFSSALWPKSGNNFIVQTKTGFKAYYDNSSKYFTTLAKNIQSVDWMPDGQRVLYVWKSSDNIHQSLVLANADGTGFRNVADLFWSDLVVKVSPNGKKALLYRSGIQGDINKIYMVDIETGAISTVVDQGKNDGALWVTSDRFVYSQVESALYPKLYLKDIVRDKSEDLKISTTIDKTIADREGNYLYAAVANASNSKDSFVKVDLNSFTSENYFDSSEEIRGTNLMLLGSTLFFVNSRDGKIYSIKK